MNKFITQLSRIRRRMDSMFSKRKGQSSLNEIQRAHLENYLLQTRNLDADSCLNEVPVPVKNFFLPYIKHIQSINNTAYCLKNLFQLNESTVANWALLSKFNDVMRTLKNDLNELTDDLMNHLVVCNSNNVLSEEMSNSRDEFHQFSDSVEEWQLNEAANLVSNDRDSSSHKRKKDSDESNTKKSKIVQNLSAYPPTPNNLRDSSALHRGLKFTDEGFLSVFIDGACSSNGKSAAKAGYGVWFNYNHPLNVAAPVKGVPTNNNAEIQAATHAIRQAHDNGLKKIKLHTDSKFLINCITLWIHKWKRNNWMTVSKEPVKNRESLVELDNVMPLMEEVRWEYVEGHKGIAGNEEADALAKKGATLYRNKI